MLIECIASANKEKVPKVKKEILDMVKVVEIEMTKMETRISNMKENVEKENKALQEVEKYKANVKKAELSLKERRNENSFLSQN